MVILLPVGCMQLHKGVLQYYTAKSGSLAALTPRTHLTMPQYTRYERATLDDINTEFQQLSALQRIDPTNRTVLDTHPNHGGLFWDLATATQPF